MPAPAVSVSTASTVLQDFSHDPPSRSALRSPKLWTPAKVGDLDLDQIHRNIRAAALDFGRRGWKVIQVWGMVANSDGDLVCACPLGAECKEKSGKHPVDYSAGLFDRATSDLDTIARWWDEHPESNVGIVGRDPIGVIIDLDRLKENENGPDGFELWQKLEDKHGPADPTFTEESGTGRHLFFAVPPDVSVGNWLEVIAKLPKASGAKVKIDVKGRNGYVVAAPSLHQSGNLYRVTQDLPLAMAPSWLIGPSLTTGVRQTSERTPTSWTPKAYNAHIEEVIDELLARMTDRDAKLAAPTNRRIHHGVPGADQSVVIQQIITGASAKNLHPDTLFEWLRNPNYGGGEGLRRRIREHGEAFAYEWMVTNYREALRYRAEQVVIVQDLRAKMDEDEGSPTEISNGRRVSVDAMKTVLHAILDVAEEFTTTEPMVSKTKIAKVTGLSRMTVWRAIQGWIALGRMEVKTKPEKMDGVWTYRLLPADPGRPPEAMCLGSVSPVEPQVAGSLALSPFLDPHPSPAPTATMCIGVTKGYQDRTEGSEDQDESTDTPPAPEPETGRPTHSHTH